MAGFVVLCMATCVLAMCRRRYARQALLQSTAAARVVTFAPATADTMETQRAAAQIPGYPSDPPPSYSASATGYQATGYQATGYQATGYQAIGYQATTGYPINPPPYTS